MQMHIHISAFEKFYKENKSFVDDLGKEYVPGRVFTGGGRGGVHEGLMKLFFHCMISARNVYRNTLHPQSHTTW